ncbi:glucose-6-phosphate dehydrogenase assembly protein OpcA [Gloeothece verrucosa]|nr:glucose-6-phosphate dehydrogenase assembly protein OpcA [Gloeothece verrucosa]
MTTDTPPLVSLQAPKDVSIDELETSLTNIWQTYNNKDDGLAATRATTFTFIVYETEGTQQLLTALGYYSGPIDGIAGPRTVLAIKAAQKAYGLEITGKSNQQLLTKLQETYAQAIAEGRLTNAEEKAVQMYPSDLEGAGLADAIAAVNPCRIITLCPTVGEDEGVTAQVSAYCPINKRSQQTLICCEYITLRGTAEALDRIGGMISELAITELPKYIWWKASPEPEYGLFKRLAAQSDSVIIDSSTFTNPETDLLKIGEMLEKKMPMADLNWGRLAAWQELTAEAFDAPERRSAIGEIDRVVIDYEKGNPAQAWMFLGWVASRLKWLPVAYKQEGGDYDLRRVTFMSPDKRTVEAELAAIPLEDYGDIAGDLISIKLSSTNLQADCCTVLCSETKGCMRMEASGGAQSCRIEQVTSLADQNTEQLLGQQLRRWGQDHLYQETMELTYKILKLLNT